MTTWWLWLRFLKLVGVLAFAMGIGGALMGESTRRRQRAAYWLATPGFLLTALAGFGMVRATGASLGAPWISGALVLSLLALDLTVAHAEPVEPGQPGQPGQPGRSRSPVRVVSILASLAAALALMIWRPGSP